MSVLDKSRVSINQTETENEDQMNNEAKLLSESPGSALLDKDKFDSIVNHLKNPDVTINPKLRHWIKIKKIFFDGQAWHWSE